MEKASVYLWNSSMGKVYSPSDSFLDNGLAYLEAACRKNGIRVQVDDPANMDFMTRFVHGPEGETMETKTISLGLAQLMPRVFIPDPSPQDMKAWEDLQDRMNNIIDGKMTAYLEDLVQKVKAGGFDILGIKTWLGKRHIYAEKLASLMQKEAPEVLVIAGGPQVNQFQEDCLAGNAFDLGIYSEGETALVKVADVVGDLKSQGVAKPEILERIAQMGQAGEIPNLVFRTKGMILKSEQAFAPLDQLPLPSYCPDPGKVNIAVVVDELGCYYKRGCAFCAHKKSVGGYRTRRINPLVEEIQHLLAQDVGLFRFSSSATSASKGYKIALKILSRKLTLEYSMFTRGEARARERYHELVQQYKTMIKAGMRAVFLGVEAANQRVLNEVVEKGNTLSDLFYTVCALKEASARAGIHVDVGLSFIHPLPVPIGMDADEVLSDNLAFLRDLKDQDCHVDSVLVTPAGPIPGSRWFEDQVRFGFDLDDDFVPTYMRYNYELGKDPKTWPDIGIRLGGLSFKDMLAENGRFADMLAKEGYAVNLTDEHCLSARACGFTGQEGLLAFKKKSDQAILCMDYTFLREVVAKINAYSKKLARQNVLPPFAGSGSGTCRVSMNAFG